MDASHASQSGIPAAGAGALIRSSCELRIMVIVVSSVREHEAEPYTLFLFLYIWPWQAIIASD